MPVRETPVKLPRDSRESPGDGVTALAQDLWIDLLGKPYRRGGRGPLEYDCLGVVLEVQRRMGFSVPDPVPAYGDDPGSAFLDHWADGWDRIQGPIPGAGVLLQLESRRWPDHVGVLVGQDDVLHVTRNARVVTAPLSRWSRAGRVRGFFWPRVAVRREARQASVGAPPGWIQVRVRLSPRPEDSRAWLEEARPGGRVRDYIGFEPDLDRLVVTLNGRRADDLDAPVSGGDDLFFCQSPAIPAVAIAGLGAAFGTTTAAGVTTLTTLGSIALAAANILAGTLVSLLASLIAAPSKPSLDSENEGSPTFALDGIRNTASNGAMIPVVYGRRPVGGQILQSFFRVNERLEAVLYHLIAVSEGEVESIGGITADSDELPSSAFSGNAVTLDGNPISNYPTAKVSIRLGKTRQSLIPGFEETTIAFGIDHDLRRSTSFAVPSQPAIVAENDKTWAYTTTDVIDGFDIIIRFPVGLYKINGDGDVQEYSFTGTLRYERVDAPASQVAEIVYFGPSTNRAPHPRQIVKRSLQKGIYRISLTRVTSNDDETERRFSQSTIVAVNEVNSDLAIAHNGLALIAITGLTGAQFGGQIPNVVSDVKGLKVYVWDGVSTTSPTFAKVYSANPGWCWLHALLNKRFGGGNTIRLNNVHLSAVKDLADESDALITTDGYQHKRYEFNHVFDQVIPLFDVLQTIAAVGRATTMMLGGKYSLKMQKARTPRQLFCMGDIQPGTYQHTLLKRFGRPNMVRVEYSNERLDYDRDVAQLEAGVVDDGQLIAQDVALPGCTSPHQAFRAAKYFLNVAERIDEHLRIKVPVDSLGLEAGDLFHFSHDWPLPGSLSGRVIEDIAVPSAGVKIDRTVVVPASPAWTILVQSFNSNGTISLAAPTATPGTYPAGTAIPISPNWNASALPKKGDLYSIGPATSYVEQWDCVAISRDEDLVATIEAMKYDATVYNDDPGVIEEFTDEWPRAKRVPEIPEGLRLSEITRRRRDGTIDHVIDVSFTPARELGDEGYPALRLVPHAARDGAPHDIWLRNITSDAGDLAGDEFDYEGRTSWRWAGETRNGQFEIGVGLCLHRGYEVSVTPRSAGGYRMAPEGGAREVIVVRGKLDMPGAPTGLAAYPRMERTLLTWDELDDSDVDHYEGREASADYAYEQWFFGQTAFRCACGDRAEFMAHGGTMKLLLKGRTRSGIGSQTPAVLSHTPETLPAALRTNTFESASWPGTKVNCSVAGVGYLRTTYGQASGTYTTTDTAYPLSKYAQVLSIFVDAHPMDLNPASEMGFPGNGVYAGRLRGDGTLTDDPLPPDRTQSEDIMWKGNSYGAQIIKGNGSHDFSKLHLLLVEYDLATDDPPTVWDGWKEYRAPIFVQGKTYVRVRLTFTNAASGKFQTEVRTINVRGLGVALFECGTVTMNGTSAKTVNFTRAPYPTNSVVFAEPVNTNSGWKVLRTNKTASSVDLQVVDANGEPVTGAQIQYWVGAA